MEKKENIFAKINIKDYTNRLEKILEKKGFSLDTKNLLLSMLYKIENGYNDYAKTKVDVPSKNEFIENVFKIIKDECNEIIVAEFNSEASSILKSKNVKSIIEKDEKRIIAFGNELLVFNCILSMAEHEICIPQEKQILQSAISNLLNMGDRINKAEVIRDFNGWSWDAILKETLNIYINFIFQNMLYLSSYEFIENWINNESKLADYLELFYANIKENFGEKRAERLINILCKFAIDMDILRDEEQYKFWKEKKKNLKEELNKLQDKVAFLEEKTEEKKEFTKQIEEIDKILNNKEILRTQYMKRNAKLPNKEKIFSISHFVDVLVKEREEILDKIKQCNNIIEPKGYVSRKQKIEEKVRFLEQIDIENKQNKEELLIELCNIFLECFQIKIAKSKTKQEILKYIYELRYYGFLTFDENGLVLKDILSLQENFNKTRKALLEKAKKLNAIEDVTDDQRVNEEILNNIFSSKMIDLDNMVIETKVEEGKLYVEYYDEKVMETKLQIQSDKTIKLKKKTKIFI